MENPLKMDDLGGFNLLFSETPISYLGEMEKSSTQIGADISLPDPPWSARGARGLGRLW